MTILAVPRSKQEADKEIQLLKAVADRICSQKDGARKYLIKHGFITPKGRLTKRYKS